MWSRLYQRNLHFVPACFRFCCKVFNQWLRFSSRLCSLVLVSFTLKTTFTSWHLSGYNFPAHLHHMIERLRMGMDKKTAIIISFFQFFYTSIFGIYSAYLFVRTGNFVAPFIVHAFCNHMGFPDIPDLISQPEPKRCIFFFLYVVGLVGWILLLPTMTTPQWFQNQQFWINSTNQSSIWSKTNAKMFST